jgi:stage II sporulation protein D
MRWRSLAALAFAGAGACAPRGAHVPTVPVVVIRDSTVTNRPPPRDTVVIGPTQPAQPAEPAGPAPNAMPVSVGLIVDTSAVEITSAGDFAVLTEDGREIGRLRGGQTLELRDEGSTVSMTSRGGPAGSAMQPPSQVGAAGLRPPLLVRPAQGGTLSLRGQPYRGELRVQQAPGGGLTVVNRLDMESYLMGVVPREIGRFDLDIYEAIKAQAVAARTYAVTYMGRRSQQGFDVYATTEDQVYGGASAENETVNRAVRETSGEIVAYNGRPITAYYHSTCAGYTAAIDEVWNNAPVPYLVAVRDVDPGGQAYDRVSSRFTWTERWTHDELVGILNRTLADSLRGRRIGRIEDMRVTARTPSGRVRSLRLETDAGSFTLGRDRVRWILTPTRGGILNSSKFDVALTRSGGRVTEIVANGGGWGHGIGMCQVGAMGRARAGQDYRTILRTYYPGTEIQKLY